MTTAPPRRLAPATIERPALLRACAWRAHHGPRGVPPGAAPRPRARHGPARPRAAGRAERRTAQERWGLPAAAPVLRGDEAGRAGGGLPRGGGPQGGAHGVGDSSRLAGKRRHRRATPARLAVQPGRTRRRRPVAGARQGGRSVRVPRVADADRRPGPRAGTTAPRERPRGLNRIQGVLASHGLAMPPGRAGPPPWAPLRLGDGPRVRRDAAPVASRRGSPWWRERRAWPRGKPHAGPGARRRRRLSRKKCHHS
jgi:hypothetical protein